MPHAIVIGGGTPKAAKEADAFTLTTITLAQVRGRGLARGDRCASISSFLRGFSEFL